MSETPPVNPVDGFPFDVIVEESMVGIYLIQDGVMRYCNSSYAGITGHLKEQIIGHPIKEFVAPDSIDKVVDNINKRLELGEGSSTRYFLQARHIDGHLVDLEVHGRSILFQGRPAIAGVAVNMTQQMNYERDLRESHKQLQIMTHHVNELREDRRQEMAREIHDVLGGLLTSIKMSASRIFSRSDHSEIKEIAEDIINQSQESINFARSKSEQLYPATLNYLGLKPTLENFLNQQRKATGLKLTLTSDCDLSKLSADAALVIFRTIQEALTNVARHAEAQNVDIAILRKDDQLVTTIADNGIGLDRRDAKETGSGLLFMKERATKFKGEVTAKTRESGGTEITMTLPFSKITKTKN